MGTQGPNLGGAGSKMSFVLRHVDAVTSIAEVLSLEILHTVNRTAFGDIRLLQLCEMPKFHGDLPPLGPCCWW